MDNPSKHLRRGFNWLGGATIATKVIDFVTILLVLLFLTKAQMGIASLVISIGTVVEAANGLGTNEALVRAKSVSRVQLDSIFWFIFGETTLIAALVLIAAPFVGAIYGVASMWIYFVVVALKQPIVGAAKIPLAMMNRDLQYERLAIVSMSATLAAALTRLGLAADGAGTWALVIGNGVHGLYTLLGTQLAKPFRPRIRFQFSSIAPLIKFGTNVSASSMLQQLFRNIDYLLIGWFYGPSQLAIYRIAFDIAMEPAVAVSKLMGRTVFPIITKVMTAKNHLVQVLAWSLSRVVTLVAPLIVAMMLLADPLTALIHDGQGQSYAAAATPLKLLAVAALLRVIFQLVYPLILVSGRSVIAVKLSAVTLLLLSVGILIVGSSFHAQSGLIATSAVWLALYPLLLIWGARYLQRSWEIRLVELSRAFIVPGIGIVLMLAFVEVIRLIVGGVGPRVQIGLVIAATGLTYGGLFLHAKVQSDAIP